MINDTPNLLPEFENIILKMKKSLQEYAARVNANKIVIEKQTSVINELIDIYNHLAALQFYENWLFIEKVMKTIETYDPEIHGFNIIFRIKPNGNNFALINNPTFS